VFERFTERARQVVVLAQDEARMLTHNYIGTEHLLLGLIREEEGLAARVLESFGITLEQTRAQVSRIVGHGEELSTGQIPFTPRAKKILELSLREAMSMQHNYIGTEHLLLGLVRENEGVAARIMLEYGASPEAVRTKIVEMLSGPGAGAAGRLPLGQSWAGQDVPGVGFYPAEPVTTSAIELKDPPSERRWLTLAVGGAIFAGGLFAGWLIWA
jgi:ATP-dependent Clp protease ATP-binding subunit ClpC